MHTKELHDYLMQNDPLYAANYRAADKTQPTVLSYLLAAAKARGVRNGLLDRHGHPQFRNTPTIIQAKRP